MRQQRDFRQGDKSDDSSAEHEEAVPGTTPSIPEGNALVVALTGSLSTLRSTDALTIDRERRAIVNDARAPGTYTGHIEEIRKMQQQVYNAAKTDETTPTNAIAIVQHAHTALVSPDGDILELIRKEMGLDVQRAELLTYLDELIDVESGLTIFARDAQTTLGSSCNSIQELGTQFPNLTLSEVSLLPLLIETPKNYLLYGTVRDTRDTFAPLMRAPRLKTNEFNPLYNPQLRDPRKRIPQVLGFGPHGISFTLDTFEFIGGHDLDESNLFNFLGLAGAKPNVEFIPFESSVRESLEALIPLTVSSARLYERLVIESTESLAVGLGRITQCALERQNAWVEGKSVEENVSNVRGDPYLQLERTKRVLLQNMLRCKVYDPVRRTYLPGEELIKLLGILESLPQCLIQETPFCGYLTPSGTRILFFNEQGEVCGQSEYSSYHARGILQGIYQESIDDRGENRTMLELADRMMRKTRQKVMDWFEDNDEAELSPLENIAFEIWMSHETALSVLPKMEIRAIQSLTDHHRLAKYQHMDTSMKIGNAEALQYQQTLSLLDRKLTEEVRTIRKDQGHFSSLIGKITGQIIAGTYSPKEKEICISEPAGYGYHDVAKTAQAERSMTLLHECGEALWTTLTDEEKARWSSISWGKKRSRKISKKQRAKNFLTNYSSTDPKEDFCEHMACYVLRGKEFRMRAAGSDARTVLGEKYRTIRRIFADRIGQVREYDNMLAFSIDQINDALEQEAKRMRAENALQETEEDIDVINISSRAELRENVESTEDLDLDDEASARREEADDPSEEVHDEEDEDDDLYEVEADDALMTREDWLAFDNNIVRRTHISTILIDALGARKLRSKEREAFKTTVIDIVSALASGNGDLENEITMTEILDVLNENKVLRGKKNRVIQYLQEMLDPSFFSIKKELVNEDEENID